MSKLLKSIEPDNISPFFDSWSRFEKEISALHVRKDNKSDFLMKQGIALYKALLQQCSGDSEKLEPLNNLERLTFVEDHPSSYAAFRQLQELFNEMHKKIASKRAMLNN